MSITFLWQLIYLIIVKRWFTSISNNESNWLCDMNGEAGRDIISSEHFSAFQLIYLVFLPVNLLF